MFKENLHIGMSLHTFWNFYWLSNVAMDLKCTIQQNNIRVIHLLRS